MNKLDCSILGGDPLSLDDLEFMQNSLAEGIRGLASILQSGGSDPVIISGLTGTISGLNTVYTSGYIAVQSEIYYVPAATIVTAGGGVIDITQTTDGAGDEVFEDLSNQSTWIIRRGTVKNPVGGPNEIDFADFISLQNRFVSITGCFVSQLTGWTNMGLQTTWLSVGGSYGTARYRKNPNGNVELDASVKNVDTSNGHLITQLPAGYRPANKQIFNVAVEIGGVRTGVHIMIESTGDVTYLSSTDGNIGYLALSGISFPAV